MDSPAISTASFSDEEDLEAYLASYVPLSTLPTPPPVKERDLSDLSAISMHEAVVLTPDLAGPATCLANLVPSNACLLRPSVSTIHNFLLRSDLPLEIIGLAACILDALSSRFAPAWRKACSPTTGNSGLTNRLRYSASCCHGQSASLEPEVAVLSALSLAAAYLDDSQKSARYWAQVISADRYTAKQINATNMSILFDIDYGLQSFTPDMIAEAILDMRRVGNVINGFVPENESAAAEPEGRRTKPKLKLQGTTVMVNGLHTPEPSP